MKRITLGTITVAGHPQPASKILASLMQPPPGQFLPLGELRRRLKILDAIEAAEGEDSPNAPSFLDLEDADHAVAKAAVENAQFGIVDRALIALADAVIDAQSVPLH